MAVNKVITNEEVLIDLTTDTVTSADHIVKGYIGHLADGSTVTGTAEAVTSDADALPSDVLKGKTFYNADGHQEGTIETKTASDITTDGATVNIPGGYYASDTSKTIDNAGIAEVGLSVSENPTMSVDSNGLVTSSYYNVFIDGIKPVYSAGWVDTTSSTSANVNVHGTYQLPTQAATTITPTTSSQTAVTAGKYTTGDVTVDAIPVVTMVQDADNPLLYKPTNSYEEFNAILTSGKKYVYGDPPNDTFAMITAYADGDELIYRYYTADTTSTDGNICMFCQAVYTSSGCQLSDTFSLYDTYDADATVSDVLSGKIFYNADGKQTGTIETQAATTITPTTSSQTAVSAGKYTTGAVTVAAIPSNYIVPSGSINITENETVDVTNYASAVVNVPSSGGVSNVVTGTFTGTTKGKALTVPLNYTGSGYPLAAIIFPTEGAYNAEGDFYNTTHQYALDIFAVVKSYPDAPPTYTTSGDNNQAVTISYYKYSSSNPKSMSTTSTTTNTFSSDDSVDRYGRMVRFKSATTMSVYISYKSYGFLVNTPYQYCVLYSS